MKFTVIVSPPCNVSPPTRVSSCFVYTRLTLVCWYSLSPFCFPRPASSTWNISLGCTTGTPARTPGPPSATSAERRCQASPPTACPAKVRGHTHTQFEESTKYWWCPSWTSTYVSRTSCVVASHKVKHVYSWLLQGGAGFITGLTH